jgi:biotin transporter BioY
METYFIVMALLATVVLMLAGLVWLNHCHHKATMICLLMLVCCFFPPFLIVAILIVMCGQGKGEPQ